MDFKLSLKQADYVWINGDFVKWEDAYIHVLTHSLHYSGAVFEGERAYNGKIFKLMQHTERLLKSADYMHLKVDYSARDINEASKQLLKKNKLKDAYIRPLIWRGAEAMGVYNPSLKCNIMIMALNSSPAFKNNIRLLLTPWRKIGVDAMPPQCKSSAHYAMMIISQKTAQDAGFDDALILDRFDNIAESSTTNIFFMRDNELVTPIADRFLNGITRQTVIEMVKNLGLEVKEARLGLDELYNYNSCFLTGTAAEIKGVSSISFDNEKVEFNNNRAVEALQVEYAKLVGKTI